jgi:hypothetical protein
MLLVLHLDTKIGTVLVQLFSRSCLSAVQVGQALKDAELSESVVNVIESFLVMLSNICLKTKILAMLVQFSRSCLLAVQLCQAL